MVLNQLHRLHRLSEDKATHSAVYSGGIGLIEEGVLRLGENIAGREVIASSGLLAV